MLTSRFEFKLQNDSVVVKFDRSRTGDFVKVVTFSCIGTPQELAENLRQFLEILDIMDEML